MHFDLWPAPMRAGLCGGSRLPICGGVASTPEFGGRPEAKAEAPAILWQTRPLDLEPRPQGDSCRLPATWKGIRRDWRGFCTPYFKQLSLLAPLVGVGHGARLLR